jgi:hypothetical protein
MLFKCPVVLNGWGTLKVAELALLEIMQRIRRGIHA